VWPAFTSDIGSRLLFWNLETPQVCAEQAIVITPCVSCELDVNAFVFVGGHLRDLGKGGCNGLLRRSHSVRASVAKKDVTVAAGSLR
jgi:hypothetical protein